MGIISRYIVVVGVLILSAASAIANAGNPLYDHRRSLESGTTEIARLYGVVTGVQGPTRILLSFTSSTLLEWGAKSGERLTVTLGVTKFTCSVVFRDELDREAQHLRATNSTQAGEPGWNCVIDRERVTSLVEIDSSFVNGAFYLPVKPGQAIALEATRAAKSTQTPGSR